MNAIDLKGRTAIITGGARGIGFAAAQKMLASGAAVALWDIDAAALGKAAASLAKSGRVYTEILDLTDEAEIGKAVETLIRDAGKIDIVVNNAGITGGNAPLWELTPEVWRRVIEVNLVAPYLVCRAVVPHMVAAAYGRIVNIASIAGKEGNPNASHYSASKAGVVGMTLVAARDLASRLIRVNTIASGTFETPLLARVTDEIRDDIRSLLPFKLTSAQRHLLLHSRTRGYKGIFPFLKDLEEKRYKQYIRVFLRQYQSAQTCTSCGGAKLQPDALHVRVAGQTIADVADLPAGRLLQWLDELALSDFERQVAEHVITEARNRVRFLCDVGLGYLSLNRSARSLSGGEAQRIALANSLGAHLVDTLYVLDEPSIGLHPRDMDRLLRLLDRLRDSGNTVLMVEHDLDAIRRADWIVDVGPAAGEQGGHVIYSGPPPGMTHVARAISRRLLVRSVVPARRRPL